MTAKVRDKDSVSVSEGLAAVTRSHTKARKTPPGSSGSCDALIFRLLVIRIGRKRVFLGEVQAICSILLMQSHGTDPVSRSQGVPNTGIPGEAKVSLPSLQISQGKHVGGRFLIYVEATFPLANRPTNRARLKGNGCFYYLDVSFFSCDPKGESSVPEQPCTLGSMLVLKAFFRLSPGQILRTHRYVGTFPFYKEDGQRAHGSGTSDTY